MKKEPYEIPEGTCFQHREPMADREIEDLENTLLYLETFGVSLEFLERLISTVYYLETELSPRSSVSTEHSVPTRKVVG